MDFDRCPASRRQPQNRLGLWTKRFLREHRPWPAREVSGLRFRVETHEQLGTSDWSDRTAPLFPPPFNETGTDSEEWKSGYAAE